MKVRSGRCRNRPGMHGAGANQEPLEPRQRAVTKAACKIAADGSGRRWRRIASSATRPPNDGAKTVRSAVSAASATATRSSARSPRVTGPRRGRHRVIEHHTTILIAQQPHQKRIQLVRAGKTIEQIQRRPRTQRPSRNTIVWSIEVPGIGLPVKFPQNFLPFQRRRTASLTRRGACKCGRRGVPTRGAGGTPRLDDPSVELDPAAQDTLAKDVAVPRGRSATASEDGETNINSH